MKALIKTSIYTLLLFALTVSSCKDDTLEEAPRLFTPVGLDITTSSGIGVCDLIIRWNAMPGVKNYTIALSMDSLQFQNIVEQFITTDNEYTFPAQRRGQRVSVRLRSNSNDLEHDSYYVEETFIIPLENIFYPVQSGDVKATSITVRFQQEALATYLKLNNLETGDVTIYPLSDSDIAAGIYKMTGVNGSTNYRVEIYYGDEIRGQRTMTTAYAPSGPNVIFLPEDVDLVDVLTNIDNIGKILILPENYEYTMTSTITIAGGMTIYGNPDGEPALITASGSSPGSFFVLPPTATSDPIEFVYCNFERGAGDGLGTTGVYMFNMSAAFGGEGSIKKLAYTNCRLANFGRGFLRVQGGAAGVVDSVVIDNCEVYNMGVANGDYGFFHIDVANVELSNIAIRNSTFNGVGCHFIYFGQDRSTTQRGCKSVTIENSTLYRMMYSGSSRWFINLGNVNNPYNSMISLRNLILGSTVLNSTADPKPVHNGIKRDNVTLTVEEVYQTNDWVVQAATAIDDARNYNGSAIDLFVDPVNGNFAIKDGSFAGKDVAGDPRWR